MSDTLEKRLGALLDEYDETRRSAQRRKEQASADDSRFIQDFADLRRNLLRPLFESVGAVLAQRGHQFSIRDVDQLLKRASSKALKDWGKAKQALPEV